MAYGSSDFIDDFKYSLSFLESIDSELVTAIRHTNFTLIDERTHGKVGRTACKYFPVYRYILQDGSMELACYIVACYFYSIEIDNLSINKRLFKRKEFNLSNTYSLEWMRKNQLMGSVYAQLSKWPV